MRATGPAAPDPSTPRRVRLDSSPPGARAALVPLDPDNGLPHQEGLIQTSLAGTSLRLRPGDYFVEVEWPNGRFHQVYRRVPRPGRNRPAESHRHERWDEVEGVIVLPDIEMPPDDVEADMVRFEGGEVSLWTEGTPGKTKPTTRDVPAFLLDPTEVTVGQFRRVYGGIPESLAQRAPADDEPVTFVPFDWAVYHAEKGGKRLPDEWEYLSAATASGSRRYPWGDDPGPVRDRPWAFGPVLVTSPFDRTSGPRAVANLYSNVAEWTVSWITADPNVSPEIFPDDLNFRNERVVRGGPFSVVERKPDGGYIEERDPRWRHSITRHRGYPGLGFRCARSVRPIFLR
jgi:formylglycine-generating enzyme required for sulfatase activity